LEKGDAERIVETGQEVITHLGGKTYRGRIISQHGDTDQFQFRGTEIERGQEEITARIRASDLQLPY